MDGPFKLGIPQTVKIIHTARNMNMDDSFYMRDLDQSLENTERPSGHSQYQESLEYDSNSYVEKENVAKNI